MCLFSSSDIYVKDETLLCFSVGPDGEGARARDPDFRDLA